MQWKRVSLREDKHSMKSPSLTSHNICAEADILSIPNKRKASITVTDY